MIYTGIWLDKTRAHVITINTSNDGEYVETIASEVDHFHVMGGSGTRFKGGPQDVVQDSRYLERENHQLKRYFEAILTDLRDPVELVVFGPAEVPEKFHKYLQEKHPKLAERCHGPMKCDSLTIKQLKSWVREFFTLQKARHLP